MSRLVDADAFREGILAQSITGKENYPTELICDFIEEQPTAYEVDKVVEEIKNIGTRHCVSVHCNDECSDCDHGAIMKEIIETVKRGVI